MYPMVKHLHLMFVAISIILLSVRFAMMLMKSKYLEKKWLKIVPHINDTLLLVSALTLCFVIGQYPFVDAWLTEKIIAVVIYIVLGFKALKARTMTLRMLAFGGALAWLMIIANIAVTKQPMFLS